MPNNLKNLTILYVEDEEMIRQNAVEYLSRICGNVLEAENGIEALEVYKKHQPDIIISDIKMPKMNGLELAERIRKEDKETPIIIATAHTQTDYLLKAVELQLVKYIVKPINSTKLKEALQMALNSSENPVETLVILDEKRQYDTLNKSLFIKNKLR
jgi:YesN/AraC family two-component response regulator